MMLIDQAMWEKFFKGFYVYDATYGFNHGRIGLLLNEDVNEDHEEYDDPWYIPQNKIISLVIDNPPETRIFSMYLGHRPLTTISSGWVPSQSELVIAADDCQVISYKTREYKGPENKIDTSMPCFNNVRVAISKLVRVETSVYAICTGLDEIDEKGSIQYALRIYTDKAEEQQIKKSKLTNWYRLYFAYSQLPNDLFVYVDESGYVYQTETEKGQREKNIAESLTPGKNLPEHLQNNPVTFSVFKLKTLFGHNWACSPRGNVAKRVGKMHGNIKPPHFLIH